VEGSGRGGFVYGTVLAQKDCEKPQNFRVPVLGLCAEVRILGLLNTNLNTVFNLCHVAVFTNNQVYFIKTVQCNL
jgi:hypothetical protein